MAQEKVMISACLAGVCCAYDGSHKLRPELKAMHEKGEAVLFCPEMLGGMKVPHSPSEISGGDGRDVWTGRARVISKEGRDVTACFVAGAQKALALARKHGVTKAITKARSPSCGFGEIYDGTFSRALRSGDGVTTALLKQSGIEVISDEEHLKNTRTKGLKAQKSKSQKGAPRYSGGF